MMKAKIEKEFKFDSEGKYAIKAMNLMREQKTILGIFNFYLISLNNFLIEKKISLYCQNIDELEDKRRNVPL